MSNKQDRQGVRTPADVERKYLLTLEETFAEVLGIATDARLYAIKTDERLSDEVARLNVAITKMEDRIVLSVADTYATNESVTSQITLAKGEILSSVEGKYETTTNVAILTQTVNSQGAKIESQAKSISANSSSLSSLTQTVNAQGATINQQAQYITNATNSISNIQQQVNSQGATINATVQKTDTNKANIANIQVQVNNQGTKIGLFVDNNNQCNASFVIDAINNKSSATLKASKIDFVSDKFTIYDTSNNVIFSAGKKSVTLGGWTVGTMTLNDGTTQRALYSGNVDIGDIGYQGQTAKQETWLTVTGVYVSFNIYNSTGTYLYSNKFNKTWYQLMTNT